MNAFIISLPSFKCEVHNKSQHKLDLHQHTVASVCVCSPSAHSWTKKAIFSFTVKVISTVSIHYTEDIFSRNIEYISEIFMIIQVSPTSQKTKEKMEESIIYSWKMRGKHKRVIRNVHVCLLSGCLQWATLRLIAPRDATSQSKLHVPSEQSCYPVFQYEIIS